MIIIKKGGINTKDKRSLVSNRGPVLNDSGLPRSKLCTCLARPFARVKYGCLTVRVGSRSSQFSRKIRYTMLDE